MDRQEDLFNIQVNEDGKKAILKIYQLTRWLFWICLLTQGAMFFYTIRDVIRYSDLGSSLPPVYYWYVRVNLIYMVLVVGISIWQTAYFLQFGYRARESVRLNDSYSFNNSLPCVYRSIRLSITGYLINGLYFIYLLIWGI